MILKALVSRMLGRLALGLVCLATGILPGGCKFGTAPEAPQTPPRIAYAASPCDTVGRPVYHAPVSSGGIVASYVIDLVLPDSLVFDPVVGSISGIPARPSAPVNYTVIATSSGGADTAVIRVCVVPAQQSATAAPWIAYDSPVVDTMTRPASHPVVSLGGQVTTYALLGSLPTGLSLNASTGLIAGTPVTAQGFVNYSVIATGPGGKDTAVIRVAIVTKVDSTPKDSTPATRPNIAYGTPVSDTVGMPASHPVISSGGAVTSYALLQGEVLPAGLTLNPATGLISGSPAYPLGATPLYELPFVLPKQGVTSLSSQSSDSVRTYSSMSYVCAVVATGPGGKDTASIDIKIVSYQDAVVGPGSVNAQLNLVLNLGASPGIVLSRLFITLTSSFPGDSVIRDTIDTGEQGFQRTSAAQTIMKSYAVRSLRHWKVLVRTPGPGTTVHLDSVTAMNILVGESRNVTMNLSALGYGKLTLNMSMGTVNGASQKASAGPLAKLIVSLSDGTSSTVPVFDTILAGTQGFSAAGPQIVTKQYAARGEGRSWQVSARVLDLENVLRYSGSATAASLATGENRSVIFTLTNP